MASVGLSAIFSDGDKFESIAEAQAIQSDIGEEILAVQYPDSNRGLYKSRRQVNNRCDKFIARCTINSKKYPKDKQIWADMGVSMQELKDSLSKAKDVIKSLEGIF